MNREPTVLDFIKSLFHGKPIPIPPQAESSTQDQQPVQPPEAQPLPSETAIPTEAPEHRSSLTEFPWRAIAALVLALIAQVTLMPRPHRAWIPGVVLYLCAAGILVWSSLAGEWVPAELPADEEHAEDYRVRTRWLYLSLPFDLLAFLTMGGNRFTTLNVLLWLLAILFTLLAFWQGDLPFRGWWMWVKTHLRLPWKLSISTWTLIILASAVLVIFFRTYRITQVPPEMVSDHAEKLLDIWDVLHGQTHIFFPRNTGREAIQFYLTAGIIQLLHTGYSFLSLKISTVLVGLLTLPFIYLLGKELGNRRIGLFAVLFAGIGYWPNVISRIGLRFPLYPMFVAPTLYFLLRGLRTGRRNEFILSGLALGIGLHGYTPIRILPILVVLAVGLYLLHPQARGKRIQVVTGLLILALISLIVFIPLLRYAIDYPSIFDFRAFSRLGLSEGPIHGSAVLVFLKNLWNASIMYFWSDGNIWVHSVTGVPALDIISAALFFLGVVLLIVRYVRRRPWQDLILLVSVPILMMPSILSLAYPDENPALNRAAGAIVPVFLIIAIALDGLMSAVERGVPSRAGVRIAWGLAIFLLFLSAVGNYDLVFNQYQRAYQLSSWNTSEMGRVISDYGNMYGSTNNAYVVPYPFWVDTRLVGMNAGDPTRDFAILQDQIASLVNFPQPKLFLVNPQDQPAINLLNELFPQGSFSNYDSKVNKDFLIFTVPPASSPPQSNPSQGGNPYP